MHALLITKALSFPSFIMLIYMVWYDTCKDNAVFMNSLQVLQNKAAKLALDKPLYSSATAWLVKFKKTQAISSLLVRL